jgi:glycosyltransferase involved in cell wall biosynthesis
MAVQAVIHRGFNRVLLYGNSWIGQRSVVNRIRKLHLPVVCDFNEWFLWSKSTRGIVIDQILFRNFCAPKLSGIIGISSFWENYANRLKKPMILIPAMGDSEFADLDDSRGKVFNVVYVGALFRRDLPQTMVNGIRMAVQRGCDFRFIILGNPMLWPEALRTTRELAADPLLRDRIEITGWVERERLREIYGEAGAFLLLRGEDWESRASSATRLPEFLSTGRPVITYLTNDVATYLQHRKHAWLLPQGDAPKELADAICYLSANGEEAWKLGRAGRNISQVKNCFKRHGERLKGFLDALASSTQIEAKSLD